MRMANTVINKRKVFDCKNFGISSTAQPHSSTATGLSFLYHANPKTAIVNPIKYGLAGTIQEKEEAMLPEPAIKAKTGVMQQSDAAIAETIPALMSLPVLMLFVFLDFAG